MISINIKLRVWTLPGYIIFQSGKRKKHQKKIRKKEKKLQSLKSSHLMITSCYRRDFIISGFARGRFHCITFDRFSISSISSFFCFWFHPTIKNISFFLKLLFFNDVYFFPLFFRSDRIFPFSPPWRHFKRKSTVTQGRTRNSTSVCLSVCLSVPLSLFIFLSFSLLLSLLTAPYVYGKETSRSTNYSICVCVSMCLCVCDCVVYNW